MQAKIHSSILSTVNTFFVVIVFSLMLAALSAMADAPPPPATGGGATAAGSASIAQANPAAPGDAAAAPAAAPAGGGSSMLIFMLLMFAFMYFFMIRPQNKKMREHQKMVSSLERGNEVITSSGILGKITGVTEKFVTLEVADNVRIRMLRTQVSQIVTGQAKDAVS